MAEDPATGDPTGGARVSLGVGFRLPMLVRLLPQVVLVLFAASAALFGDTPAWRLTWPAIATVALVAGRGSTRRLFAPSASLTVTSSELVLEHPLLSKPARIPRDHVRAVAIDEGRVRDGRFAVSESFRFGAPDAERTVTGKLLARLPSKTGMDPTIGSQFPMLGTELQNANVALVFRGAVTLPVVDGWQRFRSQAPRFAELRRPTLALLLPVRDSARVYSLFASWDVVRGLVVDDFTPDRPPYDAHGGSTAPSRPTPSQTPLPDGQSTRWRQVLALALAFGFSVIALAFSAAMLLAAVALWMADTPLAHVKAAIFALGGLSTLAMLVPRRHRQRDKGVVVTPTTQPRLWDLVRRVALATAQPVPHELVICRLPNAFVHEAGANKNARVLAIGLPFLAALSERELMSVIAHEFGHLAGGDTRVGRVVASTHRAMLRSIEARYKPGVVWWQKSHPLVLYFKFFLRVTGNMRRREEFSADRVAALIAGVGATRSAAVKSVMLGTAFDAYWTDEVVPALESGYLPPIVEGLQRFLRQPGMRERLDERTRASIATEIAEPYDSHPPTRDRLRNIGEAGGRNDDSDGAITLVRDTAGLERAVLAAEFGDEHVARLQNIPWDGVVSTVFLPHWRAHVGVVSHRLIGLTVGDIPAVCASPARFAQRMGASDPRELAHGHARAGMIQTLAMALSVALSDAGFALEGEPGGTVVAHRGAVRVAPFAVIERMAAGAIDADAWLRGCRRYQVAHLALGQTSVAAASPPDRDEPPDSDRVGADVSARAHG